MLERQLVVALRQLTRTVTHHADQAHVVSSELDLGELGFVIVELDLGDNSR